MPEREDTKGREQPRRQPAGEKPRQAGERAGEGSPEFIEGEEIRGLPKKVHGAVDLEPGPRHDA